MNFFGFFTFRLQRYKIHKKKTEFIPKIFGRFCPETADLSRVFPIFAAAPPRKSRFPSPDRGCPRRRAPARDLQLPGRRIRPKNKNNMEIKSRFDHFNINVTDLDRSIEFYDKALGLKEISRKKAADGAYELVFLGDGESPFKLELTWLRDHAATPYELGENESHLCLRVAGDYDAIREYHRSMGCVCFENHDMGLYFINDPDDYWIEVLPLKK